MIDIIYPLAKGSRLTNLELRYSLRSIEKHCRNVGKIFISGDNLDWLQNHVHIPSEPIYQCKDANINRAYYDVCISGQLSDEFLIMNDDFFFLEDCDLNEFVNYQRDYDLKGHFEKYGNRNYPYIKSIHRTMELTKGGQHFDLHIPMKCNTKNFIKCFEKYEKYMSDENAPLIRSLYGNMFIKDAPIMKDVKIDRYLQPKLATFVFMGKPFVSFGDRGLNKFTINELRRLFPKASKYERF